MLAESWLTVCSTGFGETLSSDGAGGERPQLFAVQAFIAEAAVEVARGLGGGQTPRDSVAELLLCLDAMHLENLPILWRATASGVVIAARQLAFVGFLGVAFGTGIVIFARQKRRRNRRWPFKPETRLLRVPGESTRGQFERLNEELTFAFFKGLAMVVGASYVVSTLYFIVTALALPSAARYWYLAALVGAGLGFARAVPYVAKRVTDSWDYELGYLGERFVADALQALEVTLWRAFHDMPSAFGNIDHVAVGPNGVFVIETKTRQIFKDEPNGHTVRFDGENMIWPRWGTVNRPLEQAERNANWLGDLIKKEAGIAVDVIPYVTVPGWFVNDDVAKLPGTRRRRARPVQTPALTKFIENEWGGTPLEPEKVNRIAVLLEQRCRDVRL